MHTAHRGCLPSSRPCWAPFTARQGQGRRLGATAGATTAKRGEVLLIADTVGKTHDGEKELFSQLTFSVVAGDKLAVVGANGSGKTTLLKVLAGKDEHDVGTLSRNRGATVGFLEQEPYLPPGATVLQAVLQSNSAMCVACQEYQRALTTANGAITKELELAIEKMNTYNAWEIDAEAKRVLEAVGITELNANVDKLSGGQRKRVALAAALLGKPDLLILDEPTNHMDVDIISWMERELRQEDMAVVIVTHDRYFMENVCDRMLELDGGRAFLHNFGGANSYQMWREAREFRRKAQANAAADARTLFRREAEWMAKQPKARQAKSMARQNKFYELTERTKDTPQADFKADFGNASVGMTRVGNKVVRMEKVGFSVGERSIIRDFTFDLLPGSRLGIVGRNGAGKTTLLDLIAGIKEPTAGKRQIGDTAVVGYLTQYPPDVRDDMRLIDYIREVADQRKPQPGEQVDTPEIILEKVGFARPRQFQRVESLSGGERRRLHLGSVLVARPNLLILDEPTNDLDLQTVEVLEEVAKSFKGVLIVVSHDRAFMDNVAEQLLVLNGDGLVRLYNGTYSEYLDVLAEQRAAELAAQQAREQEQRSSSQPSGSSSNGTGSQAPVKAAAAGLGDRSGAGSGPSTSGDRAAEAAVEASSKAQAKPSAPAKKRKLGYYEEQEYKKLSKEIDDLSKKRDKLNDAVVALAQSGQDFAKLEQASREMAALQEQIDEKSERWLELAELAGEL